MVVANVVRYNRTVGLSSSFVKHCSLRTLIVMPASAKPEPISRRSRPAKPPLSRAAIVAAALEIARVNGTDAVTMRRVAEALDTAAGSLYVYVANRSELIAYMLDAAFGEIDLETDRSLPWQEQLIQLIDREVAALSRYRGLALNLAGAIPVGENAVAVGERTLELLIDGGAEASRAAWGVDLLGLYATASAIEQATYFVRQADEGLIERDYLEEVRERYRAMDPAKYPVMSGMVDLLIDGSGEKRQRWAINVLIAGILATPTSMGTLEPDAPRR